MADIGFSGPGAPNISNPRSGGAKVAKPTFFVRDKSISEDQVTPETVETPREKAMRADAQEALAQSEASAPKI